jgi:hypothetical protein
MTTDGFRRLALKLPESSESSHMNHPDFRVSGKVFASLGYPDSKWGMLKLTADQQRSYVSQHPKIFVPVSGGWGRRGATNIRLRHATATILGPAMELAWSNTAPAKIRSKLVVGRH